MADIGFYALGLFVGAIITFSLFKIEDWKNPVNVVSGLLGAAVGGGIMVFLEVFGNTIKEPEAIVLYPVGLANALAWVLADRAAEGYKRAYLIIVGILTAIIMILLIEDPVVNLYNKHFGPALEGSVSAPATN